MSFEGYERGLCKYGHMQVYDVYDSKFGDDWRCHYGQPFAWSQIIDQLDIDKNVKAIHTFLLKVKELVN